VCLIFTFFISAYRNSHEISRISQMSGNLNERRFNPIRQMNHCDKVSVNHYSSLAHLYHLDRYLVAHFVAIVLVADVVIVVVAVAVVDAVVIDAVAAAEPLPQQSGVLFV